VLALATKNVLSSSVSLASSLKLVRKPDYLLVEGIIKLQHTVKLATEDSISPIISKNKRRRSFVN